MLRQEQPREGNNSLILVIVSRLAKRVISGVTHNLFCVFYAGNFVAALDRLFFSLNSETGDKHFVTVASFELLAFLWKCPTNSTQKQSRFYFKCRRVWDRMMAILSWVNECE